jgi:hypothetical protein
MCGDIFLPSSPLSSLNTGIQLNNFFSSSEYLLILSLLCDQIFSSPNTLIAKMKFSTELVLFLAPALVAARFYENHHHYHNKTTSSLYQTGLHGTGLFKPETAKPSMTSSMKPHSVPASVPPFQTPA